MLWGQWLWGLWEKDLKGVFGRACWVFFSTGLTGFFGMLWGQWLWGLLKAIILKKILYIIS